MGISGWTGQLRICITRFAARKEPLAPGRVGPVPRPDCRKLRFCSAPSSCAWPSVQSIPWKPASVLFHPKGAAP